MTDNELDEIEAVCAKATPGPWVHGEIVESEKFDDMESHIHVDDIHGPDGYDIVTTDSGVYAPALRDAKFICGARSWVPELVAEVRRLGRIAHLVAHEREECAKLIEPSRPELVAMSPELARIRMVLATAIRARRAK